MTTFAPRNTGKLVRQKHSANFFYWQVNVFLFLRSLRCLSIASIPVTATKAGPFHCLSCDIHPWSNSMAHVRMENEGSPMQPVTASIDEITKTVRVLHVN